MAKIYPEKLPANVRTDSKNASEVPIYDLLQKHLSDTYAVFYSRRFQPPRRRGSGVDDVESDFIVAHPQYGLLCLEVKGGRLRVDGATGDWINIDTHEQVKDPFDQAHKVCYAVQEWLKLQPTLSTYSFPVWYGVILPAVDVGPKEEIKAGQPRTIVLDRRDLFPDVVEQNIERMFRYYHRQNTAIPTQRGVKALVQTLAPTWYLRSYLNTDFEEEEAQIRTLTEAQFKVLDMLGDNLRFLVTGCAGSGKTMLAMHKAQQLASGGQRVLFTCYNLNLTNALREAADLPDTLTIRHFHGLCTEMATAAKIKLSSDGIASDDFFENKLPESLLEALNILPNERFDAIVVDEGQDFKTTYWTPLQLLLKDPDEGAIYIFCDDNQRIYSQDALPFTTPKLHLSDNLRNTREIGEQVGQYHLGRGKYAPAGPVSQRKPRLIHTSKYPNKVQALEDVLNDLRDEKIPAEHIIILTPLREKSEWKDKMRVGDFTLRWGIAPGSGRQISVETIQAFKGLERRVVILTELSDLSHMPNFDQIHDELLYIALSRAKHELIIFDSLPAPLSKKE